MKLSCILQVLLEITFVSVIRGNIVEVPQNTTSVYGTNVTLQCIVSRIGPTYIWFHGERRIFVMDFEGNKDRGEGTEDEYGDFSVAASSAENFSLVISRVKIEYEGTYVCEEVVLGGSAYSAELKVEAPAVNASVTCNPSNSCPAPNEEDPVVTCTCTALGAYPDTLEFEWTGIEPPTTTPIVTPTTTGRTNSFDFTQETTGSISSNGGSITCTLKNYEITEAERTAAYEYSSPACVLEVDSEDACPTGLATLVCNCTNAVPNGISYTFFHGDFTVIQGDTQSNRREDVSFTAGEETTFYCRGCNGFYFGEGSLGTTTLCEKALSTEPLTTTTEKDGGGKKDGVNIAAVVGGVIGGCAGVALVVIVIIFIVKKREKGQGGSNTVKDSTVDSTNSAPPVYGVVNKSTKKKSDNTDGKENAKLAEEQPEYAAVNKPKSQPQAAPRPRSSQPPDNKEQMELQYADLDHGNRGRTNEIHQPADEPTQYAEVKSIIV